MSLIKVDNLQVHYPIRGGFWNRVVDNVLAVDGVSFEIEPGETFGLVGESGSGKSTTGKAIVGLEKATAGTITYDGQDVTKKSERTHMDYNRDVQMIFQDSLSSLNPRKRIENIIAEPLQNFEHLSKEDEKLRVLQLLDIVGLGPDALYKYPYQFSGGQRQRIGVARAVATNPKLIIADEPVSALDLSVQAQVLNFMKKVQRELGVSYLFISHDLGVVRHMCTTIAIMHRGRLVEIGSRDDIYNHPLHIYTRRLLAAIPETNVDHREEHRQHRAEIEQEYQEDQAFYYAEDGSAFPLTKVSDTHQVALPPDKLAELEKQRG
ncbi:ATP-binding cassette domain-containing protein [Lacticaseibacillus pabuli]|uniref:ATP-binding cassette domain-containing protein n=1 Tax=Lacticaseibacillus pabuli TaxID=3025672 RepID=A0ABY7WU60_9LACO|nr:ATP-binding cassette domain-containing protein [Lacticaseibacillus sp. KACC 23028]WDF83703.1 ATP-binding cassette domain-containing protein [Lacticaseibacillus sp. KACC 23028]